MISNLSYMLFHRQAEFAKSPIFLVRKYNFADIFIFLENKITLVNFLDHNMIIFLCNYTNKEI